MAMRRAGDILCIRFPKRARSDIVSAPTSTLCTATCCPDCMCCKGRVIFASWTWICLHFLPLETSMQRNHITLACDPSLPSAILISCTSASQVLLLAAVTPGPAAHDVSVQNVVSLPSATPGSKDRLSLLDMTATVSVYHGH